MRHSENIILNNPIKPLPLPLRLGLLLALLTAEILGLSLRFDTAALSESDVWWSRLAGDTPVLLRIGMASIAALLLILAPRIKLFTEEARPCALTHGWKKGLLWQLIAFCLFSWITAAIFAAAETGQALSGGLLALWAGLGIGVFCLWLAALAPLGFWLGLCVRERRALTVAALAGLAAWLGGLLAQEFWKPLAEGTFVAVHWLLKLVYPKVIFDAQGFVLGTPDFLIRIAPQCSGYEGIGLVTVFLAIYLWLFRAEIRFPHAFLLFPLGALAIWLANALRIAVLIAIGTGLSREIALGGFHSQAGWIAFILIAFGLIWAMRRLRLFLKTNLVLVSHAASPVASALLVPLLVLMASITLTAALSSGFDRLYPLRVLATASALWYFRSVYRRWDWTFSWQAIAIGCVVFAFWMALEQGLGSSQTKLELALAALSTDEKAFWLAFRVIGSVLIVPLVEELAFRGYLLRRLSGRDIEDDQPDHFSWLPFLLSSVAFGLLHSRWVAGSLAGMAYALAVYRRGKLGDAVAAHMTTNGLIALYAVLFSQWSLWS